VAASYLVWTLADDSEERYDLPAAAPATGTIGRRAEADITLSHDPEVSRLHAELAFRAGEWTIEDDGWSQNGTFVNEMRVEGRKRLTDGDLIRVGRTLITFCMPSATSSGVTLLPGQLDAAPKFSQQQQHVLRALCRPLFGDGEGLGAADEEEIATECGIPVAIVRNELGHLERAFGLEGLKPADRRTEIAMLAVRSGLVSHDDYS
jgi:FHA domain